MGNKECTEVGYSDTAKKYLETRARHMRPDFRISEPLPLGIQVSVVVPAYQEEKNIKGTLLSLLQQSSSSFEVIVVDNGSIDRTKEVVNNFSLSNASFPIYLIGESLPGPGNSRKTGMDEVVRRVTERDKGTMLPHLIATTDADTLLPEDWISEMVSAFSRSGFGAAGGAHTGEQWIDDAIKEALQIPNYFASVALFNKQIVKSGIGKLKLSGPNAAFSVESYVKAGGIQQPRDETGKIGLKEVSTLTEKVSQNGFPLVQLESVVVSSRRRHLMELIKKRAMYVTAFTTHGDRFITIRLNEKKLLEHALNTVPAENGKSIDLNFFLK
jgi:hypothetical protein